ncbi:MAG: DUF2461 domain-containing protein [Odoribacter sp.]|nr:DUF2461 domain-containing protein [Odoribacter sp.]
MWEEFTWRIALWDEEVKNLSPKDCVYRIYRDVRFSPDKSPYKTHFGAYICGFRGRNSGRCGYYLHLQPGNCLLGGGCYCPEPALLKRLRQDIYENIEEFVSIIREPAFIEEFPKLDEQGKLKRVPFPFPADFPEADLLKYKNYDVLTLKSEKWMEAADVLEKVDSVFRKMYAFNRFLNYTIDSNGDQ